MKFIYRPKHPEADEFGMIDASLVYYDVGAAPAVISDTMAPIKHMGTGRVLDSKSTFRQDTKTSGCIEIGNEAPKSRVPIQLDRRDRREAIKRSIYELRNGRC